MSMREAVKLDVTWSASDEELQKELQEELLSSSRLILFHAGKVL